MRGSFALGLNIPTSRLPTLAPPANLSRRIPLLPIGPHGFSRCGM